MKSVLIIGLGDFGKHLCRNLLELKNEVLVVDMDEKAVEEFRDSAAGCLIADCTSKSVLKSIGVSDFDLCFVCIGKDFKSNLIIVTYLKELGAKYVISQTEDEILEKLLINNGADETIHPNKFSAMRAAVRYSSEHVFDYLQLQPDFSIGEISPLEEWIGKPIGESSIRYRWGIYIIGINRLHYQNTIVMPNSDEVIERDDKLMVVSSQDAIEKLMEQYK